MYVPRWAKKRSAAAQAGASVLAALVLVAILGGLLLVFQYVRSSGDLAYDSSSLTADVDLADNGGTKALTDSCANGTVHTIDESSGTVAKPQETPTGGSKCWIKDPNDSSKMIQGPDYASAPCRLSKQDSCVVQYCPPTSMFSTSANPGCIVVKCNPGVTSCLQHSLDTLAAGNSGSGSTALIAETLSNDPKTGVINTDGNASIESSFLTQALSPDAGGQVSAKLPQGGANTDQLLENLQGYNAPECGSGGSICTPTPVLDTNSDLATNVAQPCALTNGMSSNGTPCSNSVDTTQNTEGLDASNGGCAASMQPNGSGGCVPNSSGAGNGGCAAGLEPNGSGGCVTVPSDDTFGKNCPAGQTGSPPNCNTPPPGGGGGGAAGGAAAKSGGFDLNSLASTGISFLTGLVRGMNISAAQQQAAQAYQQAMAPYGVGNNGLACPPPQAQPDPSTCTVGAWQQIYQSNQCPSSWQCVPNSSQNPATQPTAQLSCQPQTADVGMTISMSYSCGNATGSNGSGFNTQNQLSGSATAVVGAPPAGATAITYGLTCLNQSSSQSLAASAQCSVQINEPSIVLVANPSSVNAGAASAVGWVTSGMSACTISSPTSASFTAANVGNTSVNGVATTPPLTAPITVVLNCLTLSGGTKSATTQITVGGVGAPSTAPVTVSSSVDGGTLSHGSPVSISWSSTNPPSGAAMSLWLVNTTTGKANAVIAGGLGLNGTYTWNVPAVGASCNQNASNVCDTDLVDGQSYQIEAVLYTPSNAYIGDGTEPANPVAPTYGTSAVGGTFTVNDSASAGD